MAYYLAVEIKPNSYESINIKRTPLGRNLFLNDTDECTLEEIDRYTTQYINLGQLNHELYCDKAVSWPNASIAAVYVNDGKITITRDLLFRESKKYLDNPHLALEYIINELETYNLEFARELLEKIENREELEMLETLINMMQEKLEYDIPTELPNLTHIAGLLVFKTDDLNRKHEPMLYDYSKIHNVVLVIAKNEERKKEKEQSYKRTKTRNI